MQCISFFERILNIPSRTLVYLLVWYQAETHGKQQSDADNKRQSLIGLYRNNNI